jgi:hypothetical protein
MDKAICNEIEVRDQEIEEVDTDRCERHRSFQMALGLRTPWHVSLCEFNPENVIWTFSLILPEAVAGSPCSGT